MMVREFRVGDELALHAVFYSAVHTVCTRDYTPEQLAAWAPAEFDAERWGERMRGIQPFVVEDEGSIAGYADVQDSGYIDHFFVSGERPRQGIGRRLMERIHQRAATLNMTRLFADVSRTAQPFFQHFGFQVVEHRTYVVAGVSIPNARMRKSLAR